MGNICSMFNKLQKRKEIFVDVSNNVVIGIPESIINEEPPPPYNTIINSPTIQIQNNENQLRSELLNKLIFIYLIYNSI